MRLFKFLDLKLIRRDGALELWTTCFQLVLELTDLVIPDVDLLTIFVFKVILFINVSCLQFLDFLFFFFKKLLKSINLIIKVVSFRLKLLLKLIYLIGLPFISDFALSDNHGRFLDADILFGDLLELSLLGKKIFCLLFQLSIQSVNLMTEVRIQRVR
jgi:hypothetical protein